MWSAVTVLGALATARGITLREVLPSRGADEPTRHVGCTGGCGDVSKELVAEAANSFPSRPERYLWEGRLRQIMEGAPGGDPCRADVVAASMNRPVGLGSRMSSFIDELILGVYRSRSFAVCNSSEEPFFGTVWSRHFRNVAEFPVCTRKKSNCGKKGSTWDTPALGLRLTKGLTRVDRGYVDDLKHFLYPFIFTFTQSTHEQVHQRLHSAGLLEGEPYLAVHVRRGDKIRKEARSIESESYADAARPFLGLHSSAPFQQLLLRELEAAKATVVYVSSDDASAAAEIGRELGSRIRVVQQPRRSEEGYRSRGYEAEEDVMVLLTDVEALRRATTFVGTATSNIGRLVYFLRPKGSVSISLDDHGDWLKTLV